MWTRRELKTRAKAELKNYYWAAVGFLILAIILSVIIGLIPLPLHVILFFIPIIGWACSGIIIGLINTFLIAPISVGEFSYFTRNEEAPRSAKLGELFHCFHGGRYGTAVSCMFFKWLFESLWSLLLVIPGIVKSYQYRMVPYLAAEYPEKGRKEIFELSRQMMDGNKWNVFVLDLSFILWYILCAFTFGLGFIFFNPYFCATNAELYLKLKEERLGIPRNLQGDIPQTPDYFVLTPPPAPAAQSDPYAPEQAPVFPCIKGISGSYTGAQIPIIAGEPLIIGRDPSQCSLVVEGPDISRIHLQIEFDGTNFQVMDLSTNGTFDLQAGRLPKGVFVAKPAGTYLQLGAGDTIFALDLS